MVLSSSVSKDFPPTVRTQATGQIQDRKKHTQRSQPRKKLGKWDTGEKRIGLSVYLQPRIGCTSKPCVLCNQPFLLVRDCCVRPLSKWQGHMSVGRIPGMHVNLPHWARYSAGRACRLLPADSASKESDLQDCLTNPGVCKP